MATQCVDISADKNLSNSSPIATFAFIILYIITNVLMDPSFLYLITIVIELIITQILFQFSPRIVFLTMLFLTKQTRLSPNFKDKSYYPEENDIKTLKKIIK